jgi:hypothetical protein
MGDKDRPGGMLEISPALDRDLDKAAAGKIPPPPIEAFMSDAALVQAERDTRAASEPVHAEDLRPISRAEAARRTTFDGEHLPGLPATRRVIPPPFRRDRIDVDHHGKTWRSIPADEVSSGDMTELVGKVTGIVSVLRRETIAGRAGVAVGTDIILTGAGGVTATVDVAAPVRVFRRLGKHDRVRPGPRRITVTGISASKEVLQWQLLSSTPLGSFARFPSA